MSDALFITTPTNIRYLTGFVGVDTRDAYVLQTPERIYFFTSSLYLEQAKQLSLPRRQAGNIQIIQLSNNPIKTIGELCNKLNIKKLEFEEADLTVFEYNKLKKGFVGITLVPTINRIETMRMIKKDEEMKNIRLAAKITDECFTHIIRRIRPGITEKRLSWEIESYLKFKGGGMAFTPIVAFNANSSQPHYLSRSNNPLRRGSLILLDFGARVNGYCADMTRVVFLGVPKPEWKKAYETVLEAQQKALTYIASCSRPGLEFIASGAKADEEARDVIKRSGFPVYPHGLGHAVGLDIHEAPRLTIKKSEILKPNMVVTIEPGVYVEGQYGIRIEDLVLLKKNGIEVLSKSNKQLTIL